MSPRGAIRSVYLDPAPCALLLFPGLGGIVRWREEERCLSDCSPDVACEVDGRGSREYPGDYPAIQVSSQTYTWEDNREGTRVRSWRSVGNRETQEPYAPDGS